jgi:O-acetylhomoserine (thiol)-lyase
LKAASRTGGASGMMAITAAIQTIAEAGDNIVASSALYGGTYKPTVILFRQQGIEVRFLYPKHPVSFGAADRRAHQGRIL